MGKTRVLELLEPEFSVVEEQGRRVAQQAGDFDPELFTQTVSNSTRAAHLRAVDHVEVSLFDRGTVDCLAYARWFGLDETPFRRDVALLRYHENAFFFPFWPEIYRNDAERRATLEMAVAFEGVLVQVLDESGYNMVHVPQGVPEERATFLREELNSLLGPHQ